MESNYEKSGREGGLNLMKANSGKENTTEDTAYKPEIVGGVETGTMRIFVVPIQD
jgi:hypothetical protein